MGGILKSRLHLRMNWAASYNIKQNATCRHSGFWNCTELIAADLHFADDYVRGTVTLQDGLHGAFCYAGKTVALQAGAQSIAA